MNISNSRKPNCLKTNDAEGSALLVLNTAYVLVLLDETAWRSNTSYGITTHTMGPNNSTPAQLGPVTERRISLTQDSYGNFSAINIALSDPVNFVLSAPALQSEVCSHLQLLFQHLPCCHDQHTLSVRALSSGDIESCATSCALESTTMSDSDTSTEQRRLRRIRISLLHNNHHQCNIWKIHYHRGNANLDIFSFHVTLRQKKRRRTGESIVGAIRRSAERVSTWR